MSARDKTKMTAAELEAAIGDFGWSQQRLSRELGVSDETVRRWLDGSEIPGPAAVAVNLMLDIRWLWKQVETREPKKKV
jgi:DNA-binding transcriptional regulator YiaG